MERQDQPETARGDATEAAQSTGSRGPRYAKLGYVALAVSDIEKSRHFYEKLLGLQVTEVGPDGEVYLRCSEDHHNIILYPAGKAGLRRLAFEMENEAELVRLHEVASGLGLDPVEVSAAELAPLRQARTIRFVEPTTGTPLEFYAGQKNDYVFTPTVAKIQRLGHVVMMTQDYDDALDMFLNKLNFRSSDAIGERVTFMRCFPNPYHHSFGLARGPGRGLHHINFMVSEIDDVGKALWRMKGNDVDIVYGPGRHPPSDSVFIYFADPDAITCEYSYGMEEFPEVGARPPRALPQTQESSDTWGGPPPRITPVMIEVEEEPLVDVPVVGIL